jgi:hypothetical protein
VACRARGRATREAGALRRGDRPGRRGVALRPPRGRPACARQRRPAARLLASGLLRRLHDLLLRGARLPRALASRRALPASGLRRLRARKFRARLWHALQRRGRPEPARRTARLRRLPPPEPPRRARLRDLRPRAPRALLGLTRARARSRALRLSRSLLSLPARARRRLRARRCRRDSGLQEGRQDSPARHAARVGRPAHRLPLWPRRPNAPPPPAHLGGHHGRRPPPQPALSGAPDRAGLVDARRLARRRARHAAAPRRPLTRPAPPRRRARRGPRARAPRPR